MTYAPQGTTIYYVTVCMLLIIQLFTHVAIDLCSRVLAADMTIMVIISYIWSGYI